MNTQTEPAPATAAQTAPASSEPAPALAILPAPATATQPPSNPPRRTRRNGLVARLPKPERDMVSRMIYDGVPYLRIVAALEELEIFVTPRNISNWKTGGGYREWRAEQTLALETRLQQDTLLDLLRYDEPTQLAEVGVQALATTLSQWLVQPNSLRQLVQDPAKLRSVSSIICHLNRELRELQKYHDSSTCWRRRSKNQEVIDELEAIRTTFSSPTRPENPKALPPRLRKTTDELWPRAKPAPAAQPPAPNPNA